MQRILENTGAEDYSNFRPETYKLVRDSYENGFSSFATIVVGDESASEHAKINVEAQHSQIGRGDFGSMQISIYANDRLHAVKTLRDGWDACAFVEKTLAEIKY